MWSSAVSHGVRGADYVESLTRGCVLPAFTQQDIAPVFKCGGECLDSLKLISGCSQKMRWRWQEGGRFRRLEAGGWRPEMRFRLECRNEEKGTVFCARVWQDRHSSEAKDKKGGGGARIMPRTSGYMVVMFTEMRKIVRQIGFERQKQQEFWFVHRQPCHFFPCWSFFQKPINYFCSATGHFNFNTSLCLGLIFFSLWPLNTSNSMNFFFPFLSGLSCFSVNYKLLLR